MIGIDIVKINRFKKNINLWSKKILTESEKEEFKNSKNQLNYIASRWAAKEAIFKLTNSSEKFSILNHENGAPYVFENPNLYVSISHEREYCVVVAINTLYLQEKNYDHPI
jgi:holo-[acyl-carrier protein] synthase